MHFVFAKVLIGLLVGTLVGLTGIGGGILLLPLLVFGLGVPPIVAVGSDAVFNCLTKIGAGILHWRQGTVNWYLVAALSAGSLPGTLAGVALLAYFRHAYGLEVNELIKLVAGLLLVIIPVLLLSQGQLRQTNSKTHPPEANFQWGAVGIGLLSGILVACTSIGSGSVTMLLVMLLYPYNALLIVGTDIVHAVIVTGATGLLHFHMGTVDTQLVMSLLLGSIPGALLGTRLSVYIPGHWLKRILCGVLFVTGARMLV